MFSRSWMYFLHTVNIIIGYGVGYWRPYRFRFFYLDVPNSSVNGKSDTERLRCYQDNTTYPNIPPSKVNITCPHLARYVIVENDHFGNDTHSTGPILEICEIEIFGCSIKCNGDCWTTGYCRECNTNLWGDNCNHTCPKHCKNGICNRTTGSCDLGCKNGLWRSYCNLTCSRNCAEDVCHLKNGSCVKGCKGNYDGENCKNCDAFHYGENCEKPCGKGCINDTCFSNNGTCLLGCVENSVYPKCNSEYHSMSFHSEITTSMTPYIGAGIGTFLFLLLVVIFAIAVYRVRRKRQSTPTTSVDVTFSKRDLKALRDQTDVTEVEVPKVEDPDGSSYKNDLVIKDIAVADLISVIKDKEAIENKGFIEEFKKLPPGEVFDCTVGRLDENRPKNRFKTTFPYDHSRVKLSLENGFSSDYINANYIQNMDKQKAYIACQGPIEKTLIDHWRMIWQENVEYIVMLTNLIEVPKKKCLQYWPNEDEELELDPFSVTLFEEKVYAYYVIRVLNLKKKEVSGTRTVVQFHYTRWPDHGTPNPLNLVIFHRHFRHKINPTQHPILVHCSAGVGRTGTFIALDVLSRYGKDQGKVNILEYAKAMRKDRMSMIQNHELSTLKPVYDSKDFTTGICHLNLNITQSVLPVEQYLVYLTSHVPGRDAYYNAVTVSSFTRADEFISAQLPVTGAAIDLARLLVDQESNFLISLNPLSDINEMKEWVDEDVKTFLLHPYEINRSAQSTLSGIRKTTLRIKGKEKIFHDVHIFECLDWSLDNVLPGDTFTLINLIKQFSLDRKSKPDGHVTVISKDGATGCGVFVAVYNAIEQLQQDDEVDLCTIVQELQCRRPEMIAIQGEYEFCYRAVFDFLNMDSIYANA